MMTVKEPYYKQLETAHIPLFETTLKPRYAHFKRLYNVFPKGKEGSSMIDEGLVLYFKGPNSFTGEDMVEFQVHGGNAVKTQLLSTLSKFPTFRQAEPVSANSKLLRDGFS